MALRLGMLKCAAEGKNGCRLGIRKWTHLVAMAPPLDGALECSIASPQFTLPEFDANQDTSDNSSDFGFTFPGFSFGGSMELMAVPKRKVIRLAHTTQEICTRNISQFHKLLTAPPHSLLSPSSPRRRFTSQAIHEMLV
nr:uncharacterized protein LOC118043018 isoform X2 [Populus alba]